VKFKFLLMIQTKELIKLFDGHIVTENIKKSFNAAFKQDLKDNQIF
jgi:hypothetical protein